MGTYVLHKTTIFQQTLVEYISNTDQNVYAWCLRSVAACDDDLHPNSKPSNEMEILS